MSERQGKPSASYFEQMDLCPGSWRAQQGIDNPGNKDSDSGNLIHAALAGSSLAYESMSSDETRTYENLESRVARAMLDAGFVPATHDNEIRLWSEDKKWSGKADRIYMSNDGMASGCEAVASKDVFIADFKSGWLGAEAAPSNLQLRGLAVLAADTDGAELVYVAIIPATGYSSVSVYSRDDIETARVEIEQIIARSENPDAPRNPGIKQCKYCRAKARCPEAQSLAMSLTNIHATSVGALTTARLAESLGRVALVEKICDALKSEAKRRMQNGEEIPGYALKQGEAREKIVNLPVIHARAAEIGISTEDFTAACSLTKKAAKEMIQGATKTKSKALDAMLEKLIEGCTEFGELPAPQIVEVKVIKEAA